VPDALNLPLSYKISVELLDKIIGDSLGIHVLTPMPRIRTVWKVKPDKNQPNALLALRSSENVRVSQISPKNDFSAGKQANIRSSLASVNFASPVNATE